MTDKPIKVNNIVSFKDRLDDACLSSRSLLCVGIDTDPFKIPVMDPWEFNRRIIDATKHYVCAYKPNVAFYEAMGIQGWILLEKTIQYIRDNAKNTIIIGDAKRGDVGPSAYAYARSMFETWGFDAVTVNPWGGAETILPFLEYHDRGVFIWCRGSNAGASEIQDLCVETSSGDTMPLYLKVAKEWINRDTYGNTGMVIGASDPCHISNVRKLSGDFPILIPGIGYQGGDVAKAVNNGINEHGLGAIISVSRSIIYASNDDGFDRAAMHAARKMRGNINGSLENKRVTGLTAEQWAELDALNAMTDDQIDFSDIPEITDWSNARRGLFYHLHEQKDD